MRTPPIDINYTITPTNAVRDPFEASRPIGFCVEIGAPRSVIGKQEVSRLLHQLCRVEKKLKLSLDSFCFADTVYESLGTTVMPLGTRRHINAILVEMYVIESNIPAFLGLDAMDEHSLTPCIMTNTLVKRVVKHGMATDIWTIKLTRAKTNHLFAPLQKPCLARFTRVQLHKLHRQFFHPSPNKLFNLRKKARPEQATPETRKALEEITSRCDPCQRMKAAPHRFRVSFGAGNVRFNERIIIDIMYLDEDPVLHIVDEGAYFSAANFLPNISTKTLWKTILDSWVTIYTGMPHRILVDQGSGFGEAFAQLCLKGGVEVQRNGIEAYASLNIGEQYHQPLRTVYRKLRSVHTGADKHLTLEMTVKAMNDTLGPNGVVTSIIVFGEHPSVFTRSETPKKGSTLDEDAKIAFEARKEMEHHMEKLRTEPALRHAVPQAADVTYERNDEVLIWREKKVNNRIGEWI